MRIPKLIPAAILLTLAVPAVHAAPAVHKAKKPAGTQTASTQTQKAPAGQPASQAPSAQPFADMDTDHDGKITRAEWKGNDVAFAMLDLNGDGVLSGDELKPSSQAPPAESTADSDRARLEGVFRWMDRNHDGRVTRAEWQGDPKEFAGHDHNHDGVVTLEEYLRK